MAHENLISLYTAWSGHSPESIIPIPGSGSNRKYYRIHGANGSAIGVEGISLKENSDFIRLDRFLYSNGINVPEIYGISDSGMEYLQQDLGEIQLFSLLHTEEGDRLVESCMKSLARLQNLPGIGNVAATCNPRFDSKALMRDLNYFKYCFAKTIGLEFDEYLLDDDFSSLSDSINDTPSALSEFMYRDCQSRNVMIHNGIPYWIDFQGARPGPSVYDAASFLWQARAGFTNSFRENMVSVYADAFSIESGIEREIIKTEIRKMVLLRTLQVLGAYGFRGLVEKKAHFIESIPGALRNLQDIMERGGLKTYPELERICRLATETSYFNNKVARKLNIDVFSFSYKKGYPSDFSGNGGGFMFDCRGMHNPGRYQEYKKWTGLDTTVSDFLEERGEVQPFVSNCVELVTPTIQAYLRRGFTKLQVGFGCTGGQHRSVYCADRFAKEIARKFPDTTINIFHREQGIRLTLNKPEKK